MAQEKFRAEVGNAMAAAREAGMTPAAIAYLLRQILYTVNTVILLDKPTSTAEYSSAMSGKPTYYVVPCLT